MINKELQQQNLLPFKKNSPIKKQTNSTVNSNRGVQVSFKWLWTENCELVNFSFMVQSHMVNQNESNYLLKFLGTFKMHFRFFCWKNVSSKFLSPVDLSFF